MSRDWFCGCVRPSVGLSHMNYVEYLLMHN